jgi:hypothetical protein
VIPDEAVEAALAAQLSFKNQRGMDNSANLMRHILEAAAPHMMAEVERELSDAKRMIALLVLEAGGKVALSRRAITEVSDETIIETMQDVVNGGWVIRARVPRQN